MMLPVLLAVLAPPLACHAIDADRIYARDLAAAVPLFASISPDIEIGFAPAPGGQRVFSRAELRRIAQAHHIAGDIAGDVCFRWRVAVLSRESILAAMNESLKGRSGRIEITDQSLSAAPNGKLVFPLSGLCGFSAEPVIWRGYVLYGINHRFSTWARARISVKESRLLAAGTLTAGEPVGPAQVRVDNYEGPLSRQDPITDLKDAIGMIARFDISPGTLLTRSMLDKPKEVERGDLVQVVVETSRTHIESQGVAEQAGRSGAVITVRNAQSGRKYRGRIEDKDKVLVVPGGPVGLVAEDSKS